MAESRPDVIDDEATHYSVLGVSEDARAEDLKAAYRERALQLHPDKGGDEASFDVLNRAYRVLDNDASREAYDDELAKQRERNQLVEGGPGGQAGFSKQAAAPMPRQKTAPTPGSKHSAMHRATEWKKMGTGAGILKAIEDGATPEQRTEQLFDKFAALPRDKERQRKWLKNVRGEEKQRLKAYAKDHEKAQMEKWQKWLNR